MEYICALCGEQNTSLLSEKETEERFAKEFPLCTFKKEECETVCEDCFQIMNEEIPTKTYKEELL